LIFAGGLRRIETLAAAKKCELAFICFTDEVDEDLVKIPYAVDALVAVLPNIHPLANQKPMLSACPFAVQVCLR